MSRPFPLHARRAALALLCASTSCYRGLDPSREIADDGSTAGAGTDGGGSDDTGAAAGCDPEAPRGSLRPIRRMTREEYVNVVADLFAIEASSAYPGASGKSLTGYSTEPGINIVGEQTVEDMMHAAEDVAVAIAPKLTELLPCAGTDDDDACVETYLATIGRRAFRRPLAPDERTLLLATYAAERSDTATFAEAIAVMTVQMLQMPAFIYLVEDAVPVGEDRRLSGLELASRLSFYIWNSIPDDALLDHALAGDLDDEDGLAAETQRMFDDPRAQRGLARFFREWAQTKPLEVADKTASLFPYLDAEFAASVNESFERYVVGNVRSGASLRELLTRPTTFVDADLAEFYGLDPVDDWTEVELPADRHVGILTQPVVLAGLAHATEASYVFRGRFVRRRLLCEPPLVPPGNATSAFDQIDKPEDPTARDLSLLVRARPDCAPCHDLLDPPGLALEHFDAMGAWRETYPSGKAIDTADVLQLAGDSTAFDGPVDLIAQLADLPEVSECFARQVFRYSASRMETDADGCATERIADALGGADGSLADAFAAVPRTDGFLYRRAE